MTTATTTTNDYSSHHLRQPPPLQPQLRPQSHQQQRPILQLQRPITLPTARLTTTTTNPTSQHLQLHGLQRTQHPLPLLSAWHNGEPPQHTITTIFICTFISYLFLFPLIRPSTANDRSWCVSVVCSPFYTFTVWCVFLLTSMRGGSPSTALVALTVSQMFPCRWT